MYHSIKTETNPTFASMQRTFYPKHCSYFGDGTGRDLQVTLNNGGLNKTNINGMGHTGVQFHKYKSNVPHRRSSPSPGKDASTFYYQSDGSGRDGYVLQNNGGLRPEYKITNMGDRLLKNSLRVYQRSPLKHFIDPTKDRAEITSYMNWPTNAGRAQQMKKARIQKDLVNRLSSGSPARETTINYVLGTGEVGHAKRLSQPTFQGCKNPYDREFVRVQQKQFTQSNKIMKHVYAGAAAQAPAAGQQYMTPNEKHDFSNNLIRQIPKANESEPNTHRTVSVKKVEPEAKQVDIVQLKEAMNKIRQRQAQSVMKRQPYSVSMQVNGAREEVAKTSWKKKRGTIQMVDEHRFGSTTFPADGNQTHDTTNGVKTIEVDQSQKEGVFSPYTHNRNLSVNHSTLHESTQNIQSNMRKLEPLDRQRNSIGMDQQAVKLKLVSKILNTEEKKSSHSRQKINMTALNPSLQNTLDGKKARRLDQHLGEIAVPADIYMNKATSRTQANNTFTSIKKNTGTISPQPYENTAAESMN